MATLTKRGNNDVFGAPLTGDVIVYPVSQGYKATHQFDEKIAKDSLGQDTAWVYLNEKLECEVNLLLLGDTAAHAKTGAAFFAPGAVITISGADPSFMNTTWEVTAGSDIATKNDEIGMYNLRLRRYVDATQNTLAAATPT